MDAVHDETSIVEKFHHKRSRVLGKYYIKTNQERCVSCNACEIHCQSKNHLPSDIRFGKLTTLGPIKKKGVPRLLSMFVPCFHCDPAWCVQSCPTGAMTKRAEDGIVYVQTKLCVGCKACIQACPWNVPVMNKATKKVFKCDFCMDRLDQGLKPACVNGCTAHALDFLETSSVTYNKREAPVLGLLLQKHRALQQ